VQEISDLAVADKPRLRGVSHLVAFVVSIGAGLWLVVVDAPNAEARIVAAVYALGLLGMFGASALLHIGSWRTGAYGNLLKLDHSMIFVMIAGSYTPLAWLALDDPMRVIVLAAVWIGAGFGIVFEWTSRRIPKGWSLTLYITLGWIAVLAIPWLLDSLGTAAFVLLVAGGLLYTLGAVFHAARWPDPIPHVFGYWEVFHAMVIAAVVCHFVCIARYALPRG